MIFTLEAVQALHGDCLILHYGDPSSPRFILVDGGATKGNFRSIVERRLEAIRSEWVDEDEPLTFEMVMVSHHDSDHISGILALTGDMLARIEDRDPAKFKINTLWHNSFDDLTNNSEEELASEVAGTLNLADIGNATIPDVPNADTFTKLVLASVRQGRDLRNDAKRLNLAVNLGFVSAAGAIDRPGIVMTNADGSLPVFATEFGGGLKLTVVGPIRSQVEKLQAAWDKEIKKLRDAGRLDAANLAKLAATGPDPDNSVPNLSSIVVLVELEGKKMLLTGDALGKDILGSLEDGGLLPNGGTLELDVLKLPHHGSDRNVDKEFFRRLPAKHYVVSANGNHHNPDISMFTQFLEPGTLGRDDFTVHMTNKTGKHDLETVLSDYETDLRSRGRTFNLCYRDESQPSIKVDLLAPVTY